MANQVTFTARGAHNKDGVRHYDTIDGMMDDARDYYWYRPDGVRADNYKCRDKFIILLTDGAPNLDLRPSCGATGPGDFCPYPQKAAQVAQAMWADATRRVTTYVIGFSVNDDEEQSLNDIAVAGGTTAAIFVDDKEELADALAQIIGQDQRFEL